MLILFLHVSSEIYIHHFYLCSQRDEMNTLTREESSVDNFICLWPIKILLILCQNQLKKLISSLRLYSAQLILCVTREKQWIISALSSNSNCWVISAMFFSAVSADKHRQRHSLCFIGKTGNWTYSSILPRWRQKLNMHSTATSYMGRQGIMMCMCPLLLLRCVLFSTHLSPHPSRRWLKNGKNIPEKSVPDFHF